MQSSCLVGQVEISVAIQGLKQRGQIAIGLICKQKKDTCDAICKRLYGPDFTGPLEEAFKRQADLLDKANVAQSVKTLVYLERFEKVVIQLEIATPLDEEKENNKFVLRPSQRQQEESKKGESTQAHENTDCDTIDPTKAKNCHVKRFFKRMNPSPNCTVRPKEYTPSSRCTVSFNPSSDSDA